MFNSSNIPAKLVFGNKGLCTDETMWSTDETIKLETLLSGD